MRIKSVLKKVIISLLIMITLISSISAGSLEMNYSFALSESEERVNEMVDNNSTGFIGAILNAFASVFVSIFRAIRSVNYYLASADGVREGVTPGEITPFDIFFNRFTLLDANIFDTEDLTTTGLVYQIRVNTAMWYYAIRTIAISIIAVMLIWNLIRALSKTASADQKVIAKNAVTDWVMSFALIMFMHIIVIMVLDFNDVILKAIASFTPLSNTSDFLDSLEDAIFAQNFILKIACLVVYALLNWQTFKYILVYIQRFLTIVLLVIISPIVPVTYSTDRMRGGKGTALNSWLRELLYNVFVQTLHAVIYAALVGVSMAALTTSVTGIESLATAVMAIAAMLFIKYAEKMLKTIFGFDSSQVINTNIFSNAATTIGSVATSITHAGQRLAVPAARVANGGPLISFGQNVDGSHIGLGQVAQGAAYNAGRGIRNAPRTAKGMGVSFINGIRGRDGTDGEANANAEATATARAEGSEDTTAEATATAGNGETTRTENEVYSEGGASPEEIQKDQEQDRKLSELERKNRNQEEQEGQEPKTAEDKSMEKLKEALEKGKKQEPEEKKKTVTEEHKTKTTEEHKTETTEEQRTEITEEHHEETEETIEEIEKASEAAKEPKDAIPVPMEENTDPELLDKFKEEARAILTEDKATLKDWSVEIQEKLDALEGKLDEKTKNEIIENIHDEGKTDQQAQEYIKSLKKGSLEREYAEINGQLRAYMKLDDETNISNQEKMEALISAYNAQGLEIPKEIAELKNPSRLEDLQPTTKATEKPEIVETNATAGTTRTENAVKDATMESHPTEEKPKEEALEIETKQKGAVSLKDTAVKRAQETLLKLGTRVEDETELQSDFQARYEEIASKIDVKEPTMNDIINALPPDARKEYEDYKRGRLELSAMKERSAVNALALEQEADAIRRIVNEAEREGFSMEVGSPEYTATVTLANGRKAEISSSTSRGVITSLEDIRKQEEQRQKGKLA